MARWDQLPVDLLRKIDNHLELYSDRVTSKFVCTHWEHALPELSNLRQPLLLLPFTGGSLCGLYHPFEKKLLAIDLPEVGEEKVFKGSDHGWVVTVQQDGSINVVNPLTRAQFALPPRYKFPDVLKYRPDKVGDEYLLKCNDKRRSDGRYPSESQDSMHVRNHETEKISLLGAPTCKDFRAVCLYGVDTRLAYCKLGDKKWTDLIEQDANVGYCDFTICGGKIYALTYFRELMLCEDIVSCPVLRKILPLWEGFGTINTNLHLVNSCDGGIRVVRRKEECFEVEEKYFYRRTRCFEIYKMDPGGPGWIRMKSLGCDELLFMGLGAQFGIRVSESDGNRIYFSESAGNRTYFSDDNLAFDCQDILDNGIFRCEDQKVEPLGFKFNSHMIYHSPIWVMPTP